VGTVQQSSAPKMVMDHGQTQSGNEEDGKLDVDLCQVNCEFCALRRQFLMGSDFSHPTL
jgi:hypothetical protein